MKLHLGLALSSSSSSASSQFDPHFNMTDYIHDQPSKKRKHVRDDDDDRPMPLLVLKNFCSNKSHLNEEHQDHDFEGYDEAQSNYVLVHQRDGGMIGWPPVKICKKKLCHLKTGTGDGGCGGGQSVDGRSKSMYFKVHMEGIGIARKVDLNLHQSYQTLVHTLADMFDKCFEDVKLTYQDKEGDWLLAGDVPWGSFINTVQRLRLLRK